MSFFFRLRDIYQNENCQIRPVYIILMKHIGNEVALLISIVTVQTSECLANKMKDDI